MAGCWEGRIVVAARWRFPTLASGSAPFVLQRIVGTQGLESGVLEQGSLGGVPGRGAVLCQEVLVRGSVKGEGFFGQGGVWFGHGRGAGFRPNRP